MTTISPAPFDLEVPIGATRDFNFDIDVDVAHTTAGEWLLHWNNYPISGEPDYNVFSQTTVPKLNAAINGQVVTLSMAIDKAMTERCRNGITGTILVEQRQGTRTDFWIEGKLIGTAKEFKHAS